MESRPRKASAASDATSSARMESSVAPHDGRARDNSPGPDILALLDQERLERACLQQVLALRHCALDAASTHFMITDLKSRGWPIVYVNRAIARDHGYEPAELLGQSATVLAPEHLNEAELQSINETMRSGKSRRTQLRSRRKDGSAFWTGVSLEPIRDAAGDVTHYVSVGADITARLAEEGEKRRLQDQLLDEMKERERMSIELRLAQKLEAVGRLAAGLAHEINTPVQYVSDSIHFLQSAVADLDGVLSAYRTELQALPGDLALDAVRERLRAAESSADLGFLTIEVPKAFARARDGVARVAGIVRAMKEFAHPDPQEQCTADLNHAIETTLMVAHNEYKYNATVETRFAQLPEVICNVGELNQVFLNLIVNASHAIRESGKDAVDGRITITTEVNGEAALIRIADNGCGIPQENLGRIFDPFFTTKEVGKGTGQGLAIARAIVVEKHGGRIDVESSVGTGTTFTINLPTLGRWGLPG